ncbi:MAG: hypothetical protein IJV19_04575 [Prevotella sp.]|nr:hypothetical protein [Prevotella sp.]
MGRTLSWFVSRIARNTSKWGMFILLICLTRESKPYAEDKADGGSTFFVCLQQTIEVTHRAMSVFSDIMSKIILFDENTKEQLLEVFENIKDEYVPKSPDSVLAALAVKEAIEHDCLTKEHLIELKKNCDKYNQIMNVLRGARVNIDLSLFKEE